MKNTSTGAVAFLLCLLILSAYPAQAQIAHENPGNLTSISPYVTNNLAVTPANDLFLSMDSILASLSNGDFSISRDAQSSILSSDSGLAEMVKQYSPSEEEAKLVMDRFNMTADEMQALINSSEAYDQDYSDFNTYMEAGDSVNAKLAAERLQDHYSNLSSTARVLANDSTYLLDRLSGTGADTGDIENFLASLNNYTSQISSQNQRPLAMVGGTRLLLSCDQDEARAGDTLDLTAMLSAANSPAACRTLNFYADNVKVGSASTDPSGVCLFNYTVGVSLRDPLRLSASLSPQNGEPELTSNVVEVRRLPEPATLQIDVYPGQVKYGQRAEVRGSLATTAGYPVPYRTLSIWLGDLNLGSAKTGSSGSFASPLNISADMPSGQLPLTVRYDQKPGDMIQNTKSNVVLLDVPQESTQLSLDPPASSYRGGSVGVFNGTLLTGSGRPAGGANIGIYANSTLLGSGATGREGTFSILLTVPDDLDEGSTDLYAAYLPGQGRALAGSSSQIYSVFIDQGAPAFSVWSFVALLSDLRVLILLGVLILAGILLAAKIAGVDRVIFRRKPGEEAPAHEPPASSSSEVPGPGEGPLSHPSFEDEIANLDRFISEGGESLASLAQIYQALRKLAGRHGLAVELSDTPRELAHKLSERDPSLDNPVNALLFYYESAAFGHYTPNRQDVTNALFCLREISSILAGGKGQ